MIQGLSNRTRTHGHPDPVRRRQPHGMGNGVVEEIDKAKPLLYEGTARATFADRKMAGNFNGRIVLYGSFDFSPSAPTLGACVAQDHAIEFVQR